MLLHEPLFLGFFALVLFLHWRVLRGLAARKAMLLVASYVFYGAWDPRFLALIIASTLIDHQAALRIAQAARQRARDLWLLVSIVTNLGILATFKYFDFFAGSLTELAGAVGADLGSVTLDVVLPVGISFFTFQSMSYTIDVHRGVLEPRRGLLDVALFVAFFPQLVAGPIVRAAHFLPQLDVAHRARLVPWRAAVTLFFVGFFKKAVLADSIAEPVDRYFADPGAFDAVSAVLAVVGYAAQIYLDFSGYSDMAIAAALMLGYDLGENFRFPYFARSVDDFWRRWHISLSSWLRDYLYIPLGGNRRGRVLTYRNLLLTMVLGGLWHGAAWTFVAWGALHGVALALTRAWGDRRRRNLLPTAADAGQLAGQAERRAHGGAEGGVADAAVGGGVDAAAVGGGGEGDEVGPVAVAQRSDPDLGGWGGRLTGAVATLATFWFVCVAWIFFRSETFGTALEVLQTFATFTGGGAERLGGWNVLMAYLAVCAVMHWLAYRRVRLGVVSDMSDTAFAALLGAATAVSVGLTPVGQAPFIYFQF